MSIIVDVGEVMTKSAKFEWKIKNFCTGCKNVGDKLVSPIFSTSTNNNWSLLLYPKGEDKDNEDYLSIYILEHHSEISTDVANVQFIVLNNKNEEVQKRCLDITVFENEFPMWGFSDFIKRSLLNEANDILVNDTLTILCEIIINKNIQITRQNKETQINVPECQLRLKEFDDYEKLLENEKFSDVTFAVGDKKLHVHKNILSNKSEVFAAMFEHNMKENNENIVEINDITYETLKELFRFIYAGKVNEIQKLAVDLLAAAEKYALEGLKVICENCLCEKLNCNDALKYLNLADLHNAPVLRAQSINFIVTHAEDIVKQPEFKLLGELHSNVTCDVFRALVKRIEK